MSVPGELLRLIPTWSVSQAPEQVSKLQSPQIDVWQELADAVHVWSLDLRRRLSHQEKP